MTGPLNATGQPADKARKTTNAPVNDQILVRFLVEVGIDLSQSLVPEHATRSHDARPFSGFALPSAQSKSHVHPTMIAESMFTIQPASWRIRRTATSPRHRYSIKSSNFRAAFFLHRLPGVASGMGALQGVAMICLYVCTTWHRMVWGSLAAACAKTRSSIVGIARRRDCSPRTGQQTPSRAIQSAPTLNRTR